MTLAEIGEMVGLAPSSVSDIEQRRTVAPNGEAALKLDSLHRLRCGNGTTVERRAHA